MIKKEFPNKENIAGNVATPEGEALIEAGADGVKIGMGPEQYAQQELLPVLVSQISAI